MKARRAAVLRALFAVAVVTLFACATKYERGGRCWDTPDVGGSPMPCPPPGVWWALPDGGAQAEIDPELGDDGAGGEGGSQ